MKPRVFITKVLAKLRLINTVQVEVCVAPFPDEGLLAGRTMLITGGTSGIGLAIAKAALGHGTGRVVVTGRDPKKLETAAKSLGEGCIPLQWDLLQDQDMDRLFSAALKAAGGRLDTLVNCAGVLYHPPFSEVTVERWDEVMAVNLKAVYFLSHAAAKYLVDEGIQGNILNIASEISNHPDTTPYAISKYAVAGFTRGLGKELARYGIVVNGISPGLCTTKMIGRDGDENLLDASYPNKRICPPEEIANLAMFLIGPHGRNIIGDLVDSSGGITL